MSWRYPACPTCRCIGFDLKQEDQTGELLLECRACQSVLLRSEPPPTLQPKTQGGPTHAPTGGPYRP